MDSATMQKSNEFIPIARIVETGEGNVSADGLADKKLLTSVQIEALMESPTEKHYHGLISNETDPSAIDTYEDCAKRLCDSQYSQKISSSAIEALKQFAADRKAQLSGTNQE